MWVHVITAVLTSTHNLCGLPNIQYFASDKNLFIAWTSLRYKKMGIAGFVFVNFASLITYEPMTFLKQIFFFFFLVKKKIIIILFAIRIKISALGAGF